MIDAMAMTKVLVAEDDVFLSSLLVKALQVDQFEAEAALDGVQAIEKAKSWHPDLLLLDILMPNKDGFEVLEELKKEATTAQIKVLILSNLGAQEEIDRARKLGILDYLVKANTTPHEVVARIKTLLA
jgi:DNA-binding response OmpR family regulator